MQNLHRIVDSVESISRPQHLLYFWNILDPQLENLVVLSLEEIISMFLEGDTLGYDVDLVLSGRKSN
jgi:hypothetical protein